MAASVAGSLKAWLEAAGLGVAVYRRQAPDEVSYPFVTIDERISVTPDLSGDNGANPTARQQVQVNVYQLRAAESYTLVDAVTKRLHGATPTAIGTPARQVYGVHVDFASDLDDPDPDVLHTQITASVHRAL